jgi:hypothetical protein
MYIVQCLTVHTIYPTVFIRNAANLTQLLPKASKIRTGMKILKNSGTISVKLV